MSATALSAATAAPSPTGICPGCRAWRTTLAPDSRENGAPRCVLCRTDVATCACGSPAGYRSAATGAAQCFPCNARPPHCGEVSADRE